MVSDGLADTQLVVIIPTYRHPVLLTEALESVLSQTLDVPFAVLVCSDGCPFPETDVAAVAFSLAYPNIVYLRKPNGGPSSARNFAIEYALSRFSKMKVVYFLDADNRLTGRALSIGFQALVSSPEVGWVYSHIDAFGIGWNANYGVPYSPLLHVVRENFCDTGSFVRREVLEAGARFDEDARSGFEDWDFWLQCLGKGFVGKHVLFGFAYRQRPESRYREMNRLRGQVVERLRQRHWPTTSPRNLLEWEHETNPRYLFTRDIDRHRAATDPTVNGREMDPERLAADMWAYFSAEDAIWTPAFHVFGSDETMAELVRLGLIHNVLWHMERMPPEADFAVVAFVPAEGEIGIDLGLMSEEDAASVARNAKIWFCAHQRMAEMLTDEDGEWSSRLKGERLPPRIFEVKVRAPMRSLYLQLEAANKTPLRIMLGTIDRWRGSEYRGSNRARWIWRHAILPPRHTYYSNMCEYLGSSGFAPRLGKGARNIGIVVPIADFGGAEKVAYALAQELRRSGHFRTHLFVVGAPKMRLISEFEGAFDTINFLADLDFPSWGGTRTMFGEPLFMPDAPEVKTGEIVGFLGLLDFIVNCQSAPFNSLMGALKRRKIKTACYLHLADVTVHGRSSGHPYVSLGFEHAYDLFVTCSRGLADELHALGVPGDKIISVPNAASFQISEQTRALARTARAAPRGERRLRCLYIGRLDRQKGLERLVGAIRRVRRLGLAVEFRLVGASIVDDSRESWSLKLEELNVSIEPPIYDSGELLEAYLWADALLLTSRWEGAPLVIPECQQVGAIPICTDVGAVSELIANGIDGVLIDGDGDDGVAERFSEAIERMVEDDAWRRNLARAAIDRNGDNVWSRNFRELIAYIERETRDGNSGRDVVSETI